MEKIQVYCDTYYSVNYNCLARQLENSLTLKKTGVLFGKKLLRHAELYKKILCFEVYACLKTCLQQSVWLWSYYLSLECETYTNQVEELILNLCTCNQEESEAYATFYALQDKYKSISAILYNMYEFTVDHTNK